MLDVGDCAEDDCVGGGGGGGGRGGLGVFFGFQLLVFLRYCVGLGF